jgi:NAD(P)-dependent dehydrogenase (short-subunit alcohol dehydrogenase family)
MVLRRPGVAPPLAFRDAACYKPLVRAMLFVTMGSARRPEWRFQYMKLENKVAIVTGAGRGMGNAITRRFADEGAQVVIAEVDETSARQTLEQIGRRGMLVMTDMSSVPEINALVDKTLAQFGRVDILVNNAGVTKSLSFFEVTEADWDWMYSINARGLFFCMQRVARAMVEQRAGRIVNIASIAGKGFRGTSNIAYAGTKGAVIAMTRIGAAQLARDNINVNAICPGATRTHMYETIQNEIVTKRGMTIEEAQRRMDAQIPLGRSNSPADIANMACFLASAEADNITGQSFNVDGGLMWD